MDRMNCWRTTWGATLANIGKIMWSLSVGEGAGVSPIKLGFTSPELKWMFVIGLVLHAVGTQWSGMASADQREVKRHLGLNPDGTQVDLPAPPKDPFRLPLPLLVVLFLAALSLGCARMTQTLSTTLTNTNGVVETRVTRATGWAFWDAKQTLDKLRVSNGKTHSVGLTGMEQESSSTNIVPVIDAFTRLAEKLK